MARLNVYVPDELADAARSAGLNISALTQRALTTALARAETESWLARFDERTPRVRHDEVTAALDEARDELGG